MIPLKNAELGKYLKIKSIEIENSSLLNRLYEIGFFKGAEIRLISYRKSMPAIIGIGESRFAIGNDLAEKIYLEPI